MSKSVYDMRQGDRVIAVGWTWDRILAWLWDELEIAIAEVPPSTA